MTNRGIRVHILTVVSLLHRLENSVLIATLVSMLAIALMQIFLRNFFDTGIYWAESLLRIMVLWVGVLGAMVATRENHHISVDVISRYISGAKRKVAALISNIFAAGVCGVIAWYALKLVTFEYEDNTVAFGEVPMWLCQAILPFGFAVMSIRFVINAVKEIMAERAS